MPSLKLPSKPPSKPPSARDRQSQPGSSVHSRVILSIAGFDPSCGAGITADVKTASAHGCYAVTAITAITVQNTRGVTAVHQVTPGLLLDTLAALADDFDIAAVRIGMLGTPEMAAAIQAFLSRTQLPNVVLDPILASSSGFALYSADGGDSGGSGVAGSAAKRASASRPVPSKTSRKGSPKAQGSGEFAALTSLFPMATVITPNAREASALTGLQVDSLADMRSAAAALHLMGARNVVITGGHLDPATDLLSISQAGQAANAAQSSRLVRQSELALPALKSRATHGTGCAFATSLACNLALGFELAEAVQSSKQFVHDAIARAPGLGHGHGPLGL